MPDDLAAEMGRLIVAVSAAVETLPSVGRVQVAKYGDGGAHLHLFFLARPARMLQLRGSPLLDWEENLPPVPLEVTRANAEFVGGAAGRPARWRRSRLASPELYKAPCTTPHRIGQAGRMPRRTAAERHLDSVPAPAPDASSDPSAELADLLVAYHHPMRRWLTEVLALEGPANVGQLAARTDLAVGSVSHHLKVLHRQGLVEPAPDLARDTRESWWRLCDRGLSWSVDDFEEGTLGRRVAETAEGENFRHQVRAVGRLAPAAGR